MTQKLNIRLMKKLIIPFLIFICFSNVIAQTNVYHPFPIDSATWRFDYSSGSCMGYCYSYDNIMKGDTTIGLYSYKVFNVYFGNVGAIRQDISSKKVYYYSFSTNSEYLLYDFNLNVGDTIPHNWYGNRDFSDSIFVEAIDSVVINSNWRKKYILNIDGQTYASEIIEGLGNIYGPASPLRLCICFIKLICFKGDGIIQFTQSSPFSNCNNLTVIEEHKKVESVFISPNPTSGQFTITIPSDNAEIVITNIYGQQILEAHISQRKMNLQLDKNGTYLISVKTTKEITTQKLIVNN